MTLTNLWCIIWIRQLNKYLSFDNYQNIHDHIDNDCFESNESLWGIDQMRNCLIKIAIWFEENDHTVD